MHYTKQHENSEGSYTVEANGTKIYRGEVIDTRGDHSHMPPRTAEYTKELERGHIHGSAEGGTSDPNNIAAQYRDLNRGVYRHMEQGQLDAVRSRSRVTTEKIAYQNGRNIPDAFMVNDTVTYPDGHSEHIHMSFTNASNADQEAWNSADTHSLQDAGSSGPAYMSRAEYNRLMDECASYPQDSVRGEYAATRSAAQSTSEACAESSF